MQSLYALFYVLLLSSVSFVTWEQTVSPGQQALTFAGGTAVPEDCPIQLSEASFKAIEHPDRVNRWEIMQQEVKVLNLSTQPIRRAMLGFEQRFPEGGSHTAITGTDLVPTGETYRLIRKHISWNVPNLSHYGRFTVRALAIEFHDGSHWVAPRQFIGIMLQPNLDQHAPIILRVNSDIDIGYQATLTLQREKIVAYRLGVVKDTDEEYEVRLGDWVHLPLDNARSGQVITISGKDAIASLRQKQIFPKAEQVRSLANGKTWRDRGGVAIFIAEVKFADGSFWRQDLHRHELLWGAY